MKGTIITLSIGAILFCSTIAIGQLCDGTQTFKRIAITDDQAITWTVENDCKKAVYQIKEFRWSKWILLGTVNSKGKGTNDYSFSLSDACDLYKIRIDLKGDRRCRSEPYDFYGSPSAIGYMVGVTNIVFTGSTRYEIFSKEGIRVLTGCAEKVRVAELKKGAYYLNYGKQMVKFLRK